MNEENVIIFRSYLRIPQFWNFVCSLIHIKGIWLTVLMLLSSCLSDLVSYH